MKLSVIIATRNRAHTIAGCLDSIAAAFANAAPLDAEIVVVDNGSTDETAAVIRAWVANSPVAIQSLHEPRTGRSRAANLALQAARGDLLAFTDDDCRLSKDYVIDLLRHDAGDSGLVMRGGRIDLGDPTDLPLTIKTDPEPGRSARRENSSRHECISGQLHGCNITMRRAVFDRIGFFDERLGPGTSLQAGEDTDYIFRAYLADVTLEYVPDMAVAHFHGRKLGADGRKLMATYTTANGALCAKYVFKHVSFCRPFYWDCKGAVKEIVTGINKLMPEIDFSHRDKVVCGIRGAAAYVAGGIALRFGGMAAPRRRPQR